MANQSTELRELSDNDLIARLDEAKATYFNIRMNRATGQIENSSLLGKSRREIARVNTLLRQREIAAAEAAGGN